MAHKVGGSKAYRICKRAFDIAFSVCVIVAGFIPGLILCVFIVRDTGGSPIYTQERVGMGGRTFQLYKFRTMVIDSDDIEKYLDENQLNQWYCEHKVDDDPRITPLGKKLRSTSIDEIPNFINVLKGDMSLIGPRAVSREEIKWFGDDAKTALSVPAGVTGLWQTTRRNDATFESGERQAIELEYVRNVGLATDARIFLATFGAMFGKKRSGR